MFPASISLVFPAELAMLSSGHEVSVRILLEFEPYFHKLVIYVKVVQMSVFKLKGEPHGVWGSRKVVGVSSVRRRLPN